MLIFLLCHKSHSCCVSISPEGSYTDDTNQEHHTPHHRINPPQPGQPNPDPHEFDDEFDDDDPLPVIGHCKALYSFDGRDKNNYKNNVQYYLRVAATWCGETGAAASLAGVVSTFCFPS